MKNKYNITINPKIPTDQEIEEKMDFNDLMKKSVEAYNPIQMRKKMHRKRQLIMFVMVALSLALALLASHIG